MFVIIIIFGLMSFYYYDYKIYSYEEDHNEAYSSDTEESSEVSTLSSKLSSLTGLNESTYGSIGAVKGRENEAFQQEKSL
jgi:hypothetical protein